jgi:hypothetical protein
MMIVDKRISDLLPAHYRQYAPRFITFLEKYYEWLYRTSGMSDSEIADLRNDTSWLEKDIDRFIASGKLRYFDSSTDPNVLDAALIDIASTDNSGTQAKMLPDAFVMEDIFDGYRTADGLDFADKDESNIELSTVEDNILDGWFNSMGFDRVKRSRIKALELVDQVLMLSLLKHIYAIKGTEASMKLFFDLFFDEEVEIFQPKPLINVIDDNMIVDGLTLIRDDELYQEYSYMIYVANEPDYYKDVFDTIYLKLIHPSGFRVELKQVT